MLQHVVALREGHHELRAEQTAGPDQALHAVDELAQRAVVVGTVVPRAARPDGITGGGDGFGGEEVLLHDLDTVVKPFLLQPLDHAHRVTGSVTRELDLAAVEGERVALDGDDAVAGRGQWHDESAVARADDRHGGVRLRTLLQCGEELGEEGEGVPPHAGCLHGVALLAGGCSGRLGVPRQG